MAGVYIHIPYCKQACHYCNFHFSTSTKNKTQLLDAIGKEIHLRKDFLSGEKPLASKFIKNSGFEWLFRLVKDPKYLWKRYFKIVPLFIILTILEYLGFYRKTNKERN